MRLFNCKLNNKEDEEMLLMILKITIYWSVKKISFDDLEINFNLIARNIINFAF